MEWKEKFTNADISMTMHAKKYGKAKVEIWYYGDRNGVVRKVIETHAIETEEFYDKGIDED